MNTKAIAITIAFAALTVALNPAFSGIAVPAPFLPYLSYYIWEIPIIAALFLIGLKPAILITLLNTAVMLTVFPHHPFIHPIGSLISGSSTLLGAYLGSKLTARGASQEKKPAGSKIVVYSTAFGIVSRVVVMTFVNYELLHYASKLLMGVELTEPAIIAILPLIVLFNVTIVLYTIPIGYLIARTISKNLKVGSKTLLDSPALTRNNAISTLLYDLAN
jgi:riboflavin transporter FmnP